VHLGDLQLGVGVAGSPLPPVAGLTTNCPSCGVGLERERLAERVYVCECGHHFRLHADAWLALLADADSWEERWADVRPHDLLGWKVPKPYRETIVEAGEGGLNEAVRTGTATLGGQPVWLGVFDFRLHEARVPYLSLLTDPTYGGVTASLALVADVNLAEPGAAIGFTGPRVIKQSTYADLPEGFQSAEFQLVHGQVDMVVARTELRGTLAHLLRLYGRRS
jgi:acetyl-CoA carboxylase beta subunit